ncbi:hypothetical protein QJQ45_002433 [Haematococcus lacustris]|nr:hypothetical protein QJQ45_002433 [Haematococcus lacustris]
MSPMPAASSHQASRAMKFRTLRGPGPWSGLRVAYYNEAELTLLHNEILAGCCTYLKEGVRLQPGDVVLDVGANLGFTSLLAAKAVGPSGRVISLEPLPAAAAAAATNFASFSAWRKAAGASACQPQLLQVAAGEGSREVVELRAYDSALGWSSLQPDDAELRVNMAAYLDQLLDAPSTPPQPRETQHTPLPLHPRPLCVDTHTHQQLNLFCR